MILWVFPLLFPDHITLGTAVRLCRINKSFRRTIMCDYLLWKQFCKTMYIHWSSFYNDDISKLWKMLCYSSRCRECGSRSAIALYYPTKNNEKACKKINVCYSCQTASKGYAQTLNRVEMSTLLKRSMWGRKILPASFKDNKMNIKCLVDKNNKAFFWAIEFKNRYEANLCLEIIDEI